MSRLLWLLHRRGPLLALVGGALLIAATLLGHRLAIVPMQQRVQTLQAEPPRPRDDLLARLDDELMRPEAPRAQLASFYAHFDRDDQLTDRLARLYAIARSLGLEMKQAQYRMNSPGQRKLDRYQMVVPVHGSYPAVRGLITTVLRDMPTTSLDQIQFQRKDIGDRQVETLLTFTFYLSP
jgi:hypothetical protein